LWAGKCGATVEVPAAIDSPPAETEEDLLSALETPIRPVVEPGAYANMPSAMAMAAPTLPYARPAPQAEASGRMKEWVHEFFVPLGVLILGYIAILAFLAHHGAFMFAAVMGTVILATLLMFGKTVVLGLFAWYLAHKNGGSLGHPLGMILKIAGLVVALDAATLWAIEGMVAVNIITRRGEFYPVRTTFLLFAVTFFAAVLISHLVFRLEGDEAGLFSKFMAGGNLAINIMLMIVLMVIARNVAQQARASAAQAGQAAGAAGLAAPRPVIVVLTPADRAIENYIINNRPVMVSPQEWRASSVFRSKQDVPACDFLDQLDSAGAVKIYVDLAYRRGTAFRRVFVELPTNRKQRAACCAVATGFQASHPQTPFRPELPTSAKFLEIDIAR
jgi:hypothetical protein